ncbi:hypothetical protein H4R20_001773 [Coemansia guatemalensis]|uniref:Uncharacterized protein n=1 Tax=Coemansia guatemalensis TaxID=2761395 RepID=A0A9W8LUM2_9FUNG|nr:hypothetical protein H4R20_001773 [Coemansia guatemalensis]
MEREREENSARFARLENENRELREHQSRSRTEHAPVDDGRIREILDKVGREPFSFSRARSRYPPGRDLQQVVIEGQLAQLADKQRVEYKEPLNTENAMGQLGYMLILILTKLETLIATESDEEAEMLGNELFEIVQHGIAAAIGEKQRQHQLVADRLAAKLSEFATIRDSVRPQQGSTTNFIEGNEEAFQQAVQNHLLAGRGNSQRQNQQGATGGRGRGRGRARSRGRARGGFQQQQPQQNQPQQNNNGGGQQ